MRCLLDYRMKTIWRKTWARLPVKWQHHRWFLVGSLSLQPRSLTLPTNRTRYPKLTGAHGRAWPGYFPDGRIEHRTRNRWKLDWIESKDVYWSAICYMIFTVWRPSLLFFLLRARSWWRAMMRLIKNRTNRHFHELSMTLSNQPSVVK